MNNWTHWTDNLNLYRVAPYSILLKSSNHNQKPLHTHLPQKIDRKTWIYHYNKVTKGNIIRLLQASSAVILFSVREDAARHHSISLNDSMQKVSKSQFSCNSVPMSTAIAFSLGSLHPGLPYCSSLSPSSSELQHYETPQHPQRLSPYSNLRPTDKSFMIVLMHQPKP